MALEDQHRRRHRGSPGGRSSFHDAAPMAGDERLPCGRPLSQAWEQARDSAAGPDPHTADCPHCRQAADGLAALDQATRALGERELPSGRTLADRVMTIVRAEARIGRMLPLDDPALDLRITENAAAKVLRDAADTVPGARAASCRLSPIGESTAVQVAMTLAAALDQPLPDKAAQVRRAVLDAADRTLGLAVTGVDINVFALLDPPKPTPGAETGHSGQEAAR